MNLIKNHLILALSSLFIASGYGATNDMQIDEAITAEQRKTAIALAREFGMEKIESITIPPEGTTFDDLVVRGDEQLQDGIGRYKEVGIWLDYTRFDSEKYSGISPRVYACEMRIVEFVEMEIEGYEKMRVLTKNVNPELALKLLSKIQNSDFTRAPNVDAKDHPAEESMRKPEALDHCFGSAIDFYKYSLISHEEIYFTLEDDNIVIQGYERHGH